MGGKIDELNAASKAEPTADKRAADERVVNDLHLRRDALTADARATTEATTLTWPTLMEKVDKDMGDYRSLARVATFRISSSPR